LLYWYKGTNTAFKKGPLRAHRRVTGALFTCFTGTKVQILTQNLSQRRLLENRKRIPLDTLYLLYWYKSTSTDAQSLSQRRLLENRKRIPLDTLYLLYWYKITHADAQNLSQRRLLENRTRILLDKNTKSTQKLQVFLPLCY
jgi:uncharacterized protein YcfL